jgi:ABC-type Fe3+-siderophore transport system permease subunit
VEASRHAAARRRAQLAKTALAAAAAVTFFGGIGLVRAHVSSHHKRKLQPLAAPKRFTAVVQRDLLAAGIMAPAEAPPGAATAVS